MGKMLNTAIRKFLSCLKLPLSNVATARTSTGNRRLADRLGETLPRSGAETVSRAPIRSA